MAFVVRRPGGRWEIRESYVSDRGPRARTLASFKTLSDAVVDKAIRRARAPLTRDEVIRMAKRASAPIEPLPGDALARTLLRVLARGAQVQPGLRGLLIERLRADASPVDDSFTEWLGASDDERARALVELLDLADRLPHRRATDLDFPRLSSRGAER